MNKAKVKLLSHASILIEVDGKKILTDPWYFGTAFNDGWELSHKLNLEEIKAAISDVDIIWISHEHPDHFHFPTLKWIVEFIKKDVEIFFQKNNSQKVFEALKKIGYQNFKSMPHLKKISISENVELACYAHRHLDSSLAVFVKKDFWLLNINDTELDVSDINIIVRNFGNPSVLYNQFSIAGSEGIHSHLALDAASVLEKMVEHHKLLKSKVTIPFASFVRFPRQDNQHMNEFANTVFDAKEKFLENDVQLVLQAIGGNSIEWIDETRNANNLMEIDEQGEKYFSTQTHMINDEHYYEQINQMELKKTIEDRVAEWQKVSSKAVLKFLKLEPMKFRITDWNDEIWKVDFYSGTFSNLKTQEYDISISSQPLFQAFKMPFGIQTLGVSGRYRLADKYRDVPTNWKKIRIISSLYNAEIYLHPRSVFSLTTLRWLWSRRVGIISQISQQIKRFS